MRLPGSARDGRHGRFLLRVPREEGLLKKTMSQQPAIKRQKGTEVRSVRAVLGVLVLGTGMAQDEIEREGYFEVRSASTEIVDGVHTLDARTQLVLSVGSACGTRKWRHPDDRAAAAGHSRRAAV